VLITKIARRLANAVHDIDYAQRRAMEKFLDLDGTRR
jgi:hypothetical protein